jgi:hypothetical protein
LLVQSVPLPLRLPLPLPLQKILFREADSQGELDLA